MGVRRWAAAALCVPLLGLAGCTNDESQAKPRDPTTSAAPSPSASETDAAPSIPPEAMGTDEASAKAFVPIYFDALNKAMNSGETSALAALSDPSCTSCSSIQRSIEKTFKGGGYAVTEGWEAKRVERLESDLGMAFDLQVRLGDEKFYSADDKVTHHFAGDANRRMVLYLESSNSIWRVSRLDIAR